ncbi:MAG: hypothetical protein M1825_006141 [Sarcosagium campestre]|nr:MAG: hypothetical protein M1825_006141 [Sarcosagium campestre]
MVDLFCNGRTILQLSHEHLEAALRQATSLFVPERGANERHQAEKTRDHPTEKGRDGVQEEDESWRRRFRDY